MPGPRNARKKKQTKTKKTQRSQGNARGDEDHDSQETHTTLNDTTRCSDCLPPNSILPHTIPPQNHRASITVIPQERALSTYDEDTKRIPRNPDHIQDSDIDPIPALFTKIPIIHDPGTGPRVRDMHAFLASSFASSPSLDDPLCAEFAQEEMLEMLSRFLPEETALTVWFNRSRKAARVCPACNRLYRLGDVLPDLTANPHEDVHLPPYDASTSSFLLREQELSGLCSPVCFVIAGINYSSVVRLLWGRTEDELDDETWAVLDGPGSDIASNDKGLSMLLKMTRCVDLGLGDLLFPDENLDEEQDSDGSEDYGAEVANEKRFYPPVGQKPLDDDPLEDSFGELVICA